MISNTDSSYEGIYLIDKPTGLTSHDVVNVVRKKLNIKKVGHTGTLDPLATGLLIILVGRQYTKKQEHFLKQDKQYQVSMQFGIETDSYDSDGEIVKKTSPSSLQKLSKKDLLLALEKFKGKIQQTVPPFSAVKIQGKKLYQLARDKQELPELPIRTVNITQISLVSFDKDTHQAELLIDCSSGTYIRSIVHDLGHELEVGAHVISLRRTQIGILSVDNSTPLKEFQSLPSSKIYKILQE